MSKEPKEPKEITVTMDRETMEAIDRICNCFRERGMHEMTESKLYLGIPYEVLIIFCETLENQIAILNEKTITNRMRLAGIPKERTMNSFKWSEEDYPNMSLEEIKDILTLDFIRLHKNIFMPGPPGTGKTLLAKILACQAIRKGYSAKFCSAHELMIELKEAKEGFDLEKIIKLYSTRDLLIIDDITFSTPDSETAQSFFAIMSKRYGDKSTITISNNLIEDWVKKFPDLSLSEALISRIIGGAITLNFTDSTDKRLNQLKKSNRTVKLDELADSDESVAEKS